MYCSVSWTLFNISSVHNYVICPSQSEGVTNPSGYERHCMWRHCLWRHCMWRPCCDVIVCDILVCDVSLWRHCTWRQCLWRVITVCDIILCDVTICDVTVYDKKSILSYIIKEDNDRGNSKQSSVIDTVCAYVTDFQPPHWLSASFCLSVMTSVLQPATLRQII